MMIPMKKTSTIALAILLGASGCSTALHSKGDTTTTHGEVPRACPLGVEGAAVTVEDTPDGSALVFTSRDRVEELRERVNASAAIHGPGARVGPGHEGRHGHGGHHGLQAMQLPPVHAGADDVENGARLRLIPVDPADLDLLRAKVRQRALLMTTMPCHAPR